MCKGLADEIVVGDVYRYIVEGEIVGYDHPARFIGPMLKEHGTEYVAELLPEGDRVPASHVCGECQARAEDQKEEFREEIERGGLRWHCEECGGAGIVVHDDSQGFSKGVREHMGIQPPLHVTVSFTRCEQHASEEDPHETVQ